MKTLIFLLASSSLSSAESHAINYDRLLNANKCAELLRERTLPSGCLLEALCIGHSSYPYESNSEFERLRDYGNVNRIIWFPLLKELVFLSLAESSMTVVAKNEMNIKIWMIPKSYPIIWSALSFLDDLYLLHKFLNRLIDLLCTWRLRKIQRLLAKGTDVESARRVHFLIMNFSHWNLSTEVFWTLSLSLSCHFTTFY